VVIKTPLFEAPFTALLLPLPSGSNIYTDLRSTHQIKLMNITFIDGSYVELILSLKRRS